jgi:hypothetical protein
VIKAVATLNGQPTLIIGLSGENVTRLLAGEPIPLDTGPLGLPAMKVIVMGGRTEDDIRAELGQHAAALRLGEVLAAEDQHVAERESALIAQGRAEAAVAVEEAMRAESARLAADGTARGVEQGVGVGYAMTAVIRAAAGEAGT